jgi:hypothetical protein
MVQWFAQRRYEHVLMAARFYNQIWKDGDATLRIKKNSDVSKLFSESLGISPTVASLDSLSNEAIREVAKYIEAFDLMLSRDELHSASQRLMEAYALGEYLGPVTTLPLDKKLRVSAYVRDLHELYGTLQARDYVKGKELASRLKTVAKDFPSSKVDFAAYTLASDLAIEEAKSHLLARESDKAAEKIKAATEIWPTNPKLQEFRDLLVNSSGIVTARNDFDRLLSEGNYREIAKRQYEFAPAIQGDATREDAFKQIMGNLKEIEESIGKANEFSRMGQNYGAWEQLAEIRESFPDDPKLGREIELLSSKVADFTLAHVRIQHRLKEDLPDGVREKWLEKLKESNTSLIAYRNAAADLYASDPTQYAGVGSMLKEMLIDDGQTDRLDHWIDPAKKILDAKTLVDEYVLLYAGYAGFFEGDFDLVRRAWADLQSTQKLGPQESIMLSQIDEKIALCIFWRSFWVFGL